MKHYTKPELKINRFETTDVIATSCTCPSPCACNENVWDKEEFYWHNMDELTAWKDDVNWSWKYILYDGNSYCPDHGVGYKASERKK